MQNNTIHGCHHPLQRHPHWPVTHDTGLSPPQTEAQSGAPILLIAHSPARTLSAKASQYPVPFSESLAVGGTMGPRCTATEKPLVPPPGAPC